MKWEMELKKLKTRHDSTADGTSFSGLVVACCAEDGRSRVRSQAGSEQDFKLYSLFSQVSTAHAWEDGEG